MFPILLQVGELLILPCYTYLSYHIGFVPYSTTALLAEMENVPCSSICNGILKHEWNALPLRRTLVAIPLTVTAGAMEYSINMFFLYLLEHQRKKFHDHLGLPPSLCLTPLFVDP